METKQVIVVRKDLRNTNGEKVRSGKIGAQIAHGSMMFMTSQIRDSTSGIVPQARKVSVILSPEQQEWIQGRFTKICLCVESEEALRNAHSRAIAAGLTSHMVIDSGLTEFGGVPTPTCIAIGPHEVSRIDAVTAGLGLY